MGGVILFIFYGSIIFCVVASIIKIAKYATAPLHLRWELYQGSSVYELPDGWNQANLTFWQKLKSVMLDVSFLRGYYHRNRKFWTFLYLFHLGIYILILWHAWLFLRAATVDIESASLWGLAWGHVATGLAFIGGAGILIQRIVNEDLKVYYSPIHYGKWIFMLLTLLGAFYAVDVHFNAQMPALLKYVREQVTFQDLEHKLHPALAPASHVLFVSVWLIYLPFSHIMQLFFRYYHHLRWDDVPNARGSGIERRVKELLDLPITWSAPHIQSGKKWKEVATEVKDLTGVQGR
jgi:nitrate reductase gamma subunit